ncbi:MAG: EAL domain-containing protein [Methylophilaceae bacterium]
MFKFDASESISKKLILLVSLTAWAAIVLGLFVTTVNDLISTRQASETQVSMLANVLARNSASAILFNDAKAAKETLSAIDKNDIINRVEIINKDGFVFASYTNSKKNEPSFLDYLPAINELVVEQPINPKNQTDGKVRIYAELDGQFHVLVNRWLVNLAILGFALIVGLFLLRRQVNKVLMPVSRLAEAAREIVQNKKYSLRVEKTSDDELGELTDEFNQMLAQIEMRDAQLQQNSEALAQTQDAICLRDLSLSFVYVNPAFVRLFGYNINELEGRNLSLQPENLPEPELKHEEIYAIALENGGYRGEVSRQTKSGQVISVELQVSPVKDEKGNVTSYVTVSTDITEKKRVEEAIWRQANFDALTGLPNRHMFNERLQQEVKRSQRTGKPFALMFLDLDDFKDVNDSYGHDMGDQLLVETAERLMSCLRNTDAVGHMNNVARLGGDEFTIILTELSDKANVELVAARILKKIVEPFQLKGELAYVSASIGVTVFPEDADDAETLIKNADQSMYHAKNKGRNNYSYFTRSMQVEVQKRRVMINDLRIAIDEEQFRVVYQPIINLTTQQIYKAEALIRWQHPARGLVSPAEFIPLAEETGMIVEIGDWMFYQAANQVASWRKFLNENFQISINKSPVQFHSSADANLAWFDYLDGLDLPGESLVIEITEGLMLDKNAMVSDKLIAFREAGVEIAVDDFGTGYSALSYLKKFDVDYLKIDQSFVQNLSIYSEDMVLCEAIIVMAHKLGLKVIAEGVETIEQRDLLTAIGCDYGQGYLFSRPISAEEFERLALAQLKLALPPMELANPH